MTTKKISEKELPTKEEQHRDFILDRSSVNTEDRTVELSISSEEPYERWFGIEILDHNSESVNLVRMNTGANLLVNHDRNKVVGVIEKVEIGGDRKLRAVARFGKSAFAEEIFQDVVDGIRKSASVGYEVDKYVQDNPDAEEHETPIYRATKWTPFEGSLVPIPADATVGVGRDKQPEEEQEKAKMPEVAIEEKKTEVTITKENEQYIAEQAQKAVKEAQEIIALGERHGCRELAQKYLETGDGADKFRQAILASLSSGDATVDAPTQIGLTEKETRQFSFMNCLNAIANPSFEAGFERECSKAVSERTGKVTEGFLVPFEVQRDSMITSKGLENAGMSQKDLTVGTPADGGYTVATDLVATSFIEYLFNKTLVKAMGATVLPGLVGNMAIPRIVSGPTAYWIAENGSPTESAAVFDQVPMSPKQVSGILEISRLLLAQSAIAIEMLIRAKLALSVALELDRVSVSGTGTSNQPLGIRNTTGVGSVALGTNGGAPTHDMLVDLETEVAANNGDVGLLAYMANTKTRGKLKKTAVEAGHPEKVWGKGGELNGYKVGVTNQMPSNLTKGTSSGVCSSMVHGYWPGLYIGEWGGVEIMKDPYTHSATGALRVVIHSIVDTALEHVEYFSTCDDILTT